MQHKGPYVIRHPSPGIVLSYDFNQPGWLSAWQWNPAWSREEGKVTADFTSVGREGSQGIYLKSQTEQDWSIRPNKAVSVEPGELFAFKGWVLAKPEDKNAFSFWMSVTIYDHNMEVAKWNYAVKKAELKSETWGLVEHSFLIPEGTACIGLLLFGKGRGEIFIDDVELVKRDK